jgi:hypothetical protein
MAIGRRKTAGSIGRWDWGFDIGKSIFTDRVYANGSWDSEQRPIENDKFRGLFDLENLEVGWIAYIKGEGLNAKLVPVGSDYGNAPSDKHQEGLRLVIKTDESLGGDLREFISTSVNIWFAIDQLHSAYLTGAGEHPGCLPAVDIVDVRKEGTQSKPLLTPVFKIAGWQPRPFDLPATGLPLIRRAKKAGNDSEQANGGSARPTVEDEYKDAIPF